MIKIITLLFFSIVLLEFAAIKMQRNNYQPSLVLNTTMEKFKPTCINAGKSFCQTLTFIGNFVSNTSDLINQYAIRPIYEFYNYVLEIRLAIRTYLKNILEIDLVMKFIKSLMFDILTATKNMIWQLLCSIFVPLGYFSIGMNDYLITIDSNFIIQKYFAIGSMIFYLPFVIGILVLSLLRLNQQILENDNRRIQ